MANSLIHTFAARFKPGVAQKVTIHGSALDTDGVTDFLAERGFQQNDAGSYEATVDARELNATLWGSVKRFGVSLVWVNPNPPKRKLMWGEKPRKKKPAPPKLESPVIVKVSASKVKKGDFIALAGKVAKVERWTWVPGKLYKPKRFAALLKKDRARLNFTLEDGRVLCYLPSQTACLVAGGKA